MAKRQHSERDEAVPGGPRGLRQRGKGPAYYFKRQHKGHRPTIALGLSLEQARMQAQRIINAMDRGDFRLSDFQTERVGIVEALTTAVDRLGTKNQHRKKSRASYTNRVNQFAAFLAERHPRVLYLTDLPDRVGEQYVVWRRGQMVTRSGIARPETPRHHPSARTVHDDVRRLRALFNVIGDYEKFGDNPFNGVVVRVKGSDLHAPPKHLTENQVKKLLKAAKRYDNIPRGQGAASTFRGMMHEMVEFYLLTGLRKEELIYLPWSHVEIDTEGGLIEIGPINERTTLLISPTRQQSEKIAALVACRGQREKLFKNEAQVRACVPKNYADQECVPLMAIDASAWDSDTNRLSVPTLIQWKQKATQGSVPLVPATRAILKRRRKVNDPDSPFVFPHPDNGPLRSDPLPEFKKLLTTAKLPQSTRLHDLRHTFGFTLREKGVPLETIMGLMRHSDIKETMVYAKYSHIEGARSIQVLDGLTG